jgi:hypothetical protein
VGKHAASGFRNESASQKEADAGLYDESYSILAKFINEQLTVTVWNDASRRYGLSPSLQLLIALRSDRNSSAKSAPLLKYGNLVITLLEELDAELERLNNEWAHLLEKRPVNHFETKRDCLLSIFLLVPNKRHDSIVIITVRCSGSYRISHDDQFSFRLAVEW